MNASCILLQQIQRQSKAAKPVLSLNEKDYTVSEVVDEIMRGRRK